MKVIITGATGMIGGLILNHCFQSKEVLQIISIGRKKCGQDHDKLVEVIREDFLNYDDISHHFENVDGVYFCQGVYTGAVSKELFEKITVDYVAAFADKLNSHNPEAFFSFLSGAGADQTEKSRAAFAKFKGKAEKKLLNLFKNVFIFRPGYIYPVTPRKEPNVMYGVSRFLYPLIKLFGDKTSIKSTELAEAMFMAGFNFPSQSILENDEILNYWRTHR